MVERIAMRAALLSALVLLVALFLWLRGEPLDAPVAPVMDEAVEREATVHPLGSEADPGEQSEVVLSEVDQGHDHDALVDPVGQHVGDEIGDRRAADDVVPVVGIVFDPVVCQNSADGFR